MTFSCLDVHWFFFYLLKAIPTDIRYKLGTASLTNVMNSSGLNPYS